MTTSFYSVWVGGGEVNDYPLTHTQAQELADHYRNQGYEDVAVEATPTN